VRALQALVGRNALGRIAPSADIMGVTMKTAD
jgi:hypothetical protein